MTGLFASDLTQRKKREVTKASGTSDWRKPRAAALLVRLSLELKSDCLRPRRKKTVSITEGPPEFEKAKRESCLRDEFQCRGIFGEGIYVSDVDCDLRHRGRAGSRSSSTSGGREGSIWQERIRTRLISLTWRGKGAVGFRRTTCVARGQAGIRLWKRGDPLIALALGKREGWAHLH
jgi:hypothetical protein